MPPNQHQQEKLEQLRTALGLTEPMPITGEVDGYIFTEVDGVTVVITRSSYSPRGGFKVPCVRKYDESLDAAVNARSLWEAQRGRDGADSAKAAMCILGHFGPIISTDWRCMIQSCPCQDEDDIDRRRDRSLRG
jgi:hypothetical protein